MNSAGKRAIGRRVVLDRSFEELPLFRLSDTTDDAAVNYVTDGGGRWRVFANPGDRIPGTFDQDVYVELMRRFGDAGAPADGVVSFTLHAFLRAMNRQVDGRTYDQLRSSLIRLERTTLQSDAAYVDAATGLTTHDSFALLTAVSIERKRAIDRDQFALFPAVPTTEPGEARVTIAPAIRQNIAARRTATLDLTRYLSLPSPVARRLYRLLEVARADGTVTWRIGLERLRDQLPLSQRYPSHLQRVLQPAHDMLRAAGILRDAAIRQHQREWFVDYVLAGKQSGKQSKTA